MANGIQVGDTVALSQSFVERHGQDSASMAMAQGTVTVLHQLGKGIILAEIKWNMPDLPASVNVMNLIKPKAAASG